MCNFNVINGLGNNIYFILWVMVKCFFLFCASNVFFLNGIKFSVLFVICILKDGEW